MRSAHPEANAVQIASGSGKDPLPDARRRDGERSADREQECPEAWPLHGGSDSLEAEVSSADAPEPTIDREPVSVADEPVAALVDGDSLPEWSSALLAGPAGPAYFPPFGLTWSIQFINDLYKRTRAQRVPISLDDAAAAWTAAGWDGLPVAEALDHIDTLLAFGFVEQSGEGSERRIRISEVGRCLIEDPDQSPQILAEAAMKPKLIAEYIERWGRNCPTDDVCIPELKTAHGFSDEEAKLFLRVYDGTALFACKKDPLEVPEPLPQFDGPRGRQKPVENYLTSLTPEIDGFLNEYPASAEFDPDEPDEHLLDRSEHREPLSSGAMCPA